MGTNIAFEMFRCKELCLNQRILNALVTVIVLSTAGGANSNTLGAFWPMLHWGKRWSNNSSTPGAVSWYITQLIPPKWHRFPKWLQGGAVLAPLFFSVYIPRLQVFMWYHDSQQLMGYPGVQKHYRATWTILTIKVSYIGQPLTLIQFFGVRADPRRRKMAASLKVLVNR